MALFVALVISSLLFRGIDAPLIVYERLDCPRYTQGYVEDKHIVICPKELTLPREMVIKHETVHLIQDNLGVDSVLQEPLLSYLVRETLSESETLSVLVHYENSGYINGEFDARVLSRLPEPVIMTMYRLSKDYADLTSTR